MSPQYQFHGDLCRQVTRNKFKFDRNNSPLNFLNRQSVFMCCDKRDTLKWGRNRDDCANLQAIFSSFTMDLLFLMMNFFGMVKNMKICLRILVECYFC